MATHRLTRDDARRIARIGGGTLTVYPESLANYRPHLAIDDRQKGKPLVAVALDQN